MCLLSCIVEHHLFLSNLTERSAPFLFLLISLFRLLPAKNENTDDLMEGTRHFMVNVIEPQFNLHSEDANVSFKNNCAF